MRMLMKTHAFVRSNTPRALANGLVKLSLLNSVPKSEEKFISDNQGLLDKTLFNFDEFKKIYITFICRLRIQ